MDICAHCQCRQSAIQRMIRRIIVLQLDCGVDMKATWMIPNNNLDQVTLIKYMLTKDIPFTIGCASSYN